jgi:hypothetical protein
VLPEIVEVGFLRRYSHSMSSLVKEETLALMCRDANEKQTPSCKEGFRSSVNPVMTEVEAYEWWGASSDLLFLNFCVWEFIYLQVAIKVSD